MSDDFIKMFQKISLTQLQDSLEHVSHNQMARLRDDYQTSNKGKEMNFNRLEQALIALPLIILTQPKPEHMSDFEYTTFTVDILQSISMQRDMLSRLRKS